MLLPLREESGVDEDEDEDEDKVKDEDEDEDQDDEEGSGGGGEPVLPTPQHADVIACAAEVRAPCSLH